MTIAVAEYLVTKSLVNVRAVLGILGLCFDNLFPLPSTYRKKYLISSVHYTQQYQRNDNIKICSLLIKKTIINIVAFQIIQYNFD